MQNKVYKTPDDASVFEAQNRGDICAHAGDECGEHMLTHDQFITMKELQEKLQAEQRVAYKEDLRVAREEANELRNLVSVMPKKSTMS